LGEGNTDAISLSMNLTAGVRSGKLTERPQGHSPVMDAPYDLFLNLMTRCLTDSIYDTVSRDWPARAHTTIGFKRLANIRACVEMVLDDGVLGDLIETGVWHGGAAIFMRAILKARAVTDRVVWVADSFAGLPPPDTARYPHDDFRSNRGITDPIQTIDWGGAFWRRSAEPACSPR
jgi:Macrocin-O-methyltransferase (TylF)